MDNIKAATKKCIVCGKQAVAFWPCIDPDIPSQPYCRECLNKAKMKVLIETFGYSQKEAEIFTKAMEDIGK